MRGAHVPYYNWHSMPENKGDFLVWTRVPSGAPGLTAPKCPRCVLRARLRDGTLPGGPVMSDMSETADRLGAKEKTDRRERSVCSVMPESANYFALSRTFLTHW
jgi:hypothetical protein